MLNFKENLSPFAVGRRVNSEEWNTLTRTAEFANDTDRLPFGAPVSAGVGKHSCIPYSGYNFLGISEANLVLPRPGDGFARYDNVPINEFGVIAVEIAGDTVKGAAARWDSVGKKWTGAALSGTVFPVPGATFEETATAPGVGPVRLRRPNPADRGFEYHVYTVDNEELTSGVALVLDTFPVGTIVQLTSVEITEAFDGGATDTGIFGTGADTDKFLASSSNNFGATGFKPTIGTPYTMTASADDNKLALTVTSATPPASAGIAVIGVAVNIPAA